MRISTLILCSSLLVLTTNCYRMPQEDEVSVLPNTNNPTITHPGENSVIPGLALPGAGL